MTHATLRPEFETLIDPYAPVGQLGTGFTFTEGPIWHPVGHYLLFSDMPADVRRRWDATRGVVEAKRPSNKCNGMTYDADLNLIVCEHATSSLIRERTDGRREVLASHFEKQELNSPNDVCVHSSGAIYFSDPWYGRMPVYGVERPRQLGFQGVYRVPPGGGAPQLLVDRYMFDQPNGLCFSPDEKRLYVNDTVQALIRVFDVEADGSLSNARIFANGIRSELEPGLPDGMKCDHLGNIWVTAPGGIWVYAMNGDLLGKVRAPELVANLSWGGADFRTLFMTATHSVYTVTTKVGPRAEPYITAKADAGATEAPAHAPLFEGLVDSGAMVRGSWGAAPVAGLEPRPGDFIVEKMRMSAWEGSRLETILKATGRDMLIDTGAWTNMSIEHTARTGADKGYFMIVPEDCCSTMNADWHNASVNFAMQNVSVVTNADAVIKALG